MFPFGQWKNNCDIFGLWCYLLKKKIEGPYSSAAAVSNVKKCYAEVLLQGKFLQQP